MKQIDKFYERYGEDWKEKYYTHLSEPLTIGKKEEEIEVHTQRTASSYLTDHYFEVMGDV